jgi:dipicolinate synthase subunit A
MKRYFLDLKDRRLVFVKKMLEEKGEQVLDFESNLALVLPTDVCVVSPAYKWQSAVLSQLKQGTTIFGGALSDDLKVLASSLNYINLMSRENFVVENAKLTAEGFLADLILGTETSIFEQKILVLGSGRVAKALWHIFSKLGVPFDCAMRNEKELNLSKLCANSSFLIDGNWEFLSTYDTVVNTIPAQLFDDAQLFKPSCDVFELASVKCLEQTKTDGVNFHFCPSIPSKHSPQSAGKLIFSELIKGE